MDQLEVRADSPQEDEFALLTLGVPSAYRAFWLPTRVQELRATLDPNYWLANPQWLDVWEAFLRGVLRTSSDARQPLILKSPNHTFRLRAILKRFPNARAAWMMRSPAEVFESNRRMWRAMFEVHSIEAVDAGTLERLDEFLILALDAAADALNWCCDRLPPEQWVAVDQGELATRPAETVAKVWKHLNPGRKLHRDALNAAIAKRAPFSRVDYPLEVPDIVLGSLTRLDAAQRRAASANGLAAIPDH